MDWRERDGIRWLEAELPGARAAFSTRVGGVSEPPYEALNIAIKTGDEAGRVTHYVHFFADISQSAHLERGLAR